MRNFLLRNLFIWGEVMEKVKIQHYVPRFYLKNFAIQRGNEHWLNCFDKTDFRNFPVNIKDIGCEKFFYEGVEEEQILEKALSRLERDFVKVYDKLVNSRLLLGLSWAEKSVLASFVAVQDLRTREFREVLRSLGKEMKRVLGNKPLSNDLKEQLATVDTEENVRSIHSKLVTETLSGKTGFAQMILNMKWVLFENLTRIPLWTSDHPVNRFNPIDLEPFGNLGLMSRGIQVFFPLNPNLGIVFGDPVEYFRNPEKVTCIKDNVIFCNTLQVRSSTRHIFSSNNDFYLAKKWLNEHPDFTDPKRKRMEARN